MILYVTMDGGYFAKNGLDMDMQFINGGSKNLAAVVSKQVQIGYVGSEFLSAAAMTDYLRRELETLHRRNAGRRFHRASQLRAPDDPAYTQSRHTPSQA